MASHHHHHDHSHAPSRAAISLRRAIVITTAFMGIEFGVGWWSNSLALMTDAAHMLTDAGALSLSLFAFWLASRPATPVMSFGYHRAEILGALLSGLLIWLLSGLLIYEAIQRFQNPEPVHAPSVVVVAFLGLIVNIVNLRILHGAESKNLNLRAATLHVLGDLLGSVGAVIAGIVIWTTGWTLVDPLVTVLFAGLVLYSAWKLVREAVGVLMESAPVGVDPEKVKNDLSALAGVSGVHDLHIWAVASGRPALSVHLVASDHQAALIAANQVLESRHGILHTTIQVEHPDRFRLDRCFDCASEHASHG